MSCQRSSAFFVGARDLGVGPYGYLYSESPKSLYVPVYAESEARLWLKSAVSVSGASVIFKVFDCYEFLANGMVEEERTPSPFWTRSIAPVGTHFSNQIPKLKGRWLRVEVTWGGMAFGDLFAVGVLTEAQVTPL